jgi:branched-chain amino acid transport system ATP-binding protein
MTAFENLVVVARGDQKAARRRAEELIDLVSLRHVRDEYASNLSYGQQKLLEFVRLMMTEPELVMLDEPFAGVNPTMEGRLLEQMEGWLRDGKTIVVTDHEMKIMMEICQEIFVLDYGEVIAHGTPDEVRANPRVMEAYFGR